MSNRETIDAWRAVIDGENPPAKPKKSKAKHYSELSVADWNTAHFQAYLADKHVEKFGIQYVAAGGVMAERSLLSKYIGTAKKSGLYGKETVKAFIDACFDVYKPTAQYPGLSAWFMFTYMTAELQRAELQGKRKEVETQADDFSELEGWL